VFDRLATSRLSVEVEQLENGTVLRLGGELDLATVDEASSAIERVRAQAPPQLIFDLRALEFIDSTGLHLLINTHLESGWEGLGAVHVACGKGAVRNVIELTGLDKVMSVVEDPAEVLE
jgi:anti-anti-sigma factor